MSTYKYTAKIPLPNGKYKYVRANTKKELEEKKLKVQLELRTGVDISDKTTFKELYEMWMRVYKVGKVHEATIERIRSRMNSKVLPYLGELQMQKIAPMTVAGIFSRMDDDKLSSGYQKLVYNDLKQIFEVAVDNQMISRSPLTRTITPGGRKTKKKEALSASDTEHLLDYLQAYPEFWCLTKFILATGLRIGEAFALKWDDVDLENRTVHVHATCVFERKDEPMYQDSPKTASGNRIIPFNSETKSVLLQMMLLRKGDYIWHSHGRLADNAYYNRYTRRLAASGVENVTPHVLRHCAITNWVMSGMPVVVAQHLAGHASSNITLDVYTSYCQEDHMQIAMDILEKSATKVQPANVTQCYNVIQDDAEKACISNAF